MEDGLFHLKSDYERAEYLQNILTAYATGKSANEEEFKQLRKYFLENPQVQGLLPNWIRTNRDFSQYWVFIKGKFETYQERREFIWSEFEPLLAYLEQSQRLPPEQTITQRLEEFSAESVHITWQRALKRRVDDPEGAITLSRTILESICKHILDEDGITYDSNIELHKLYKLTATQLNLAPDQHTEQIFKQILKGCSSVVNGLGSLRNKHGDAHGKGKKKIKPATRHAELAVNLAGTMALFLVETYKAKA